MVIEWWPICRWDRFYISFPFSSCHNLISFRFVFSRSFWFAVVYHRFLINFRLERFMKATTLYCVNDSVFHCAIAICNSNGIDDDPRNSFNKIIRWKKKQKKNIFKPIWNNNSYSDVLFVVCRFECKINANRDLWLATHKSNYFSFTRRNCSKTNIFTFIYVDRFGKQRKIKETDSLGKVQFTVGSVYRHNWSSLVRIKQQNPLTSPISTSFEFLLCRFGLGLGFLFY